MDVPPVFPNSVNAPSEVVVRDRIQKLIRLDQISRIRTDKVEATTEYSETYYYYKKWRGSFYYCKSRRPIPTGHSRMTMMIFVLIILERGQPTGEELYFRELTSCLEYSNALNAQSVSKINELLSNNSYFKTYCRVREIPTSEAGTKILFRDPARKDDD